MARLEEQTRNVVVDGEGHLVIGGCDAVDLVERFGSPLYVMDEARIRSCAAAYVESLSTHHEPGGLVHFAGKAFLNLAMCRLVDELRMGLDVASGGELFTALHADFPPERIGFHGNNKSDEELRLALDSGVGHVVVDNGDELDRIEELAAERDATASIMLRITPGIDTHTHAYIQTGQIDSKFGFGVSGGVALEGVRRALSAPHLHLDGFHCHIGSQLLEFEMFSLAARLMFEFADEVRRQTGFEPRVLNLGGGLGIRYTAEDPEMAPRRLVESVVDTVAAEATARGFQLPALHLEPGRSIVGEAGITLYTIGSIKEIPGVRTYAAIDGGMADNPRVALYQAEYEALVANKAGLTPTKSVTVAGKSCESGDMLLWNLDVPEIEPGDVLAVFSTGAYNYSMSSNYNRLARPSVVGVMDGEAHVWVERESYEDLLRNDRVPPHLAGVGETHRGRTLHRPA